MASKHDYIRVFDHVYVSARQLFEPPSDAAAAMAPRFLEGVKLLPLLDTHTTAPFGKKGGGVLGLAISFEPQVYKWMPVDWAAVRAFAEHRLQVCMCICLSGMVVEDLARSLSQ